MPFISERPLQDILNPQAVTVAGRAMAEKGGDVLLREVRRRTPVFTGETGPLGRKRKRGTALESLQVGAVRGHTSAVGRGWERRVFTEDPVFPFIEWNTRPHEIKPTAEHIARARAEGREAQLVFFQRGQVRHASRVWHPGTRGQHPFARGAAFVESEVGHLFGRELERFGEDLTANRSGRILDRGRSADGAGWELEQALRSFTAGQAAVRS